MASEYNTDPGQGYRIPKRRRKPVAAPPPPPPGMAYRVPKRAVSTPPPPAAGMPHRVRRTKATAKAGAGHGRAKAHARAKRKRLRAHRDVLGAYALLLNKTTGWREGKPINELANAMLTNLYADPTHIAWAGYKPKARKVMKKEGVNKRVKLHPYYSETGLDPWGRSSAAWADMGGHKVTFTPGAYMAYGFNKRGTDYGKSVALHEGQHLLQPKYNPKHPMPKWWVEGGAEFWAKREAKRLGIKYVPAEAYARYRRRFAEAVRREDLRRIRGKRR